MMQTQYEEHSWVLRESSRFVEGSYKQVPWRNEPWWTESGYANLHFPHASRIEPGKMAFTESPLKGRHDTQLRIRPGRYLKRYFSDLLDDLTIRHWTEIYAEKFESFELLFATTPDEITRIYVDGPHSCMAGERGLDTHPAAIYGAGDLAVAYLTNAATGAITARALCWPEKSIHCGRFYGDTHRLSVALAKLDYTEDNDGFEGARVLAIQERDGWVFPYIDLALGLAQHCEETGTARLLPGGIVGGRGGIPEAPQGHTCYHCDGNIFEDEIYIVDDEDWCEGCAEIYAFCCENCDERTHNDDLEEVLDVRGYTQNWCTYCAENNAAICEDCSRYADPETMTSMNPEVYGDHHLCQECAEDAARCDQCEEPTLYDDLYEVSQAQFIDSICQYCKDSDEFLDCENCGDLIIAEDAEGDLCPDCHEDAEEQEIADIGPDEAPALKDMPSFHIFIEGAMQPTLLEYGTN